MGWDEIGDLRDFPTREAFNEAFWSHYAEGYKNNTPLIAQKAHELWTLRELRPGDLIIANRGISEVLGLGEVVEPGYEWRSDRSDMKHTIRVHWDTAVAKQIPSQKRWGTTTVAEVLPELFQLIVQPPEGKKAPLHYDTLLQSLAASHLSFPPELVSTYVLALQTKRFVILTGISGTGKTQLALAVAKHFQPHVKVREVTHLPEGAVPITISPYMFNYHRIVLPAALVAVLSNWAK